MDRLDVVIALLQEVKAETQRLEAMEKEIDRIPCTNTTEYLRLRHEIENYYSPIPHKSVINDYLKTARHLLAREYVSG